MATGESADPYPAAEPVTPGSFIPGQSRHALIRSAMTFSRRRLASITMARSSHWSPTLQGKIAGTLPALVGASVPCATLALVPDTANPYRDEIIGYIRRARCHYGATLLYAEADLTVEDAARELNVKPAQVNYCRRGVHNVLE